MSLPNKLVHLARPAALAALALAGALALPSRPSVAQESPATTRPAQSTLSAQQVLERYIEATGGKAAYEKLKTQRAVGTMSISGISGKLTASQKMPDKMLTVIDLEGLGQFQQGLNGNVGWDMDAMQGPRLLDAERVADRLRDNDLTGAANPKAYYETMEVVGVEKVEGKDAYRLRLARKGEKTPRDSWYDAESGLMVKSTQVQEGPAGEMRVEMLLSDYRPAGDSGLIVPYKVKVPANGMEIALETVEVNAELPDEAFAVPAEIKALQDKEKQQPKPQQ